MPGVHGSCGGVHVRVFDAPSAWRSTGEAAEYDDAKVALPLLSREGSAGKHCPQTQVSTFVLTKFGTKFGLVT